jgi:hypothetical protein
MTASIIDKATGAAVLAMVCVLGIETCRASASGKTDVILLVNGGLAAEMRSGMELNGIYPTARMLCKTQTIAISLISLLILATIKRPSTILDALLLGCHLGATTMGASSGLSHDAVYATCLFRIGFRLCLTSLALACIVCAHVEIQSHSKRLVLCLCSLAFASILWTANQDGFLFSNFYTPVEVQLLNHPQSADDMVLEVTGRFCATSLLFSLGFVGVLSADHVDASSIIAIGALCTLQALIVGMALLEGPLVGFHGLARASFCFLLSSLALMISTAARFASEEDLHSESLDPYGNLVVLDDLKLVEESWSSKRD